ncbi:helix-turn-helix domain-containing protein [Sphingopyxis sp.]|uniref:helix-turn-helix domain-containing protein n=1 Tax=Sphingopyxis sp. TaxID=1908224 RepID=UPI00262301C5|nr:AraC family transcriptional regulator [Sphingopyxis sp.]MCW0199849.1 AraC family transcriptional regulator [Sphingopyxis sp.]
MSARRLDDENCVRAGAHSETQQFLTALFLQPSISPRMIATRIQLVEGEAPVKDVTVLLQGHDGRRFDATVLGQLRLAAASAFRDPGATHRRLEDLIARLATPMSTVDRHGAGPIASGLAPWQAKRVRDLVERDLDRALSVKHLADTARLSESYFFRAFRGSFGMAPHSFIMLRRVERAKEYLRSGQEPIAQIALSCGFCDQAHLSRAFSRHFGISPSAWRRQHGHAVTFSPASA